MENITLLLEEMVKKNPNDMELGKKVRKMVSDLKSKKDGVQQKISK
jgi:hypothetical protein